MVGCLFFVHRTSTVLPHPDCCRCSTGMSLRETGACSVQATNRTPDDASQATTLESIPFRGIGDKALLFPALATVKTLREYIAVRGSACVCLLSGRDTAGAGTDVLSCCVLLPMQLAYQDPEVCAEHVTLLWGGTPLPDADTLRGCGWRRGYVVRVVVRGSAARPLPFPPPSLQRHVEHSELLDRLVQACHGGRAADVAAALDAGAAVNDVGCDVNGLPWIPLRAAVFSKHADVVALLLSRGGDPNGHKVMYSGVLNGTPDIVQQLLDAGGDVNAESFGVRPLFVAAASADDAVVRVLLSHPALELSVTVEGKTAEECARERGRTAVADMIREQVCVRVLIMIGCNPSLAHAPSAG